MSLALTYPDAVCQNSVLDWWLLDGGAHTGIRALIRDCNSWIGLASC